MPTLRHFDTNFTAGEIDPRLRARVDIRAYENGAERLRNVEVLPQGGVRRRPGTAYVDSLPAGSLALIASSLITETAPNGGTAGNADDGTTGTVVASSTNISTGDPYVLVHYDLGSAHVVEAADVRGLTYTGTAENEQFRIQRSSDDATWTDFGDPIENGGISASRIASRRRQADAGATYRYWRVARTGAGDLGAMLASIGEFWLWERSGSVPSEVRTIGFEFSTEQAYCLVLSDQNLRVYRNDVYQCDVYIPHVSADLHEITWVQSLDTLLIFHPDYLTWTVKRSQDHDQWDSFPTPLTNPPTHNFSDTLQSTSITLAPSATGPAGQSVTISASAGYFATSLIADVGYDVEFNGGLARITAIGGTTTATGLVNRAFRSTAAFVATAREPAWSSDRGYPRCGTFHEGRLYIGGSRDRPQTVWGSVVGQFFDFQLGGALANEGVEFTLDTDSVAAIHQLMSGRNLQIFTQTGEFVVLPDDEAITPSNLAVKRQTQIGALGPGVPVVAVEQGTLFLNRFANGLYEFLFDFAGSQYSAQNVSLLSGHLINAPVDMAVRRATSANQADQVYVVNADGTLAVLCTLRGQGITAWTLWETEGSILAVTVVEQDTYLAVERSINGSTVRYLERLDADLYVDAGVIYTGPITTLTGLSHLEGEVVHTRADASVLDDETVTSGNVTLDREAADDAQAGLPFPDVYGAGMGDEIWVKLLPPAIQLQTGIPIGRLKRCMEATLRVFETQTLWFGANGGALAPVVFRQIAVDALNDPPPIFTGDKTIQGITNWDEFAQGEVTQREAAPAHILGISTEVSIR